MGYTRYFWKLSGLCFTLPQRRPPRSVSSYSSRGATWGPHPRRIRRGGPLTAFNDASMSHFASSGNPRLHVPGFLGERRQASLYTAAWKFGLKLSEEVYVRMSPVRMLRGDTPGAVLPCPGQATTKHSGLVVFVGFCLSSFKWNFSAIFTIEQVPRRRTKLSSFQIIALNSLMY